MSTATGTDRAVKLDSAPVRAAQLHWAAQPIATRLRILRATRHRLANEAENLAAAVPLRLKGHLHRTLVDTICSEVLPLAEACRFLELEATELLAPIVQPKRSRPLWLSSVKVETRRQPLGLILILAPGNYPLFLPGVQALQALCAGNAVLWKPAPGGAPVALALRTMLISSGLDPLLFTVLDESIDAANEAIDAGVDKVILTGSATTGRAVLHRLADSLTPAVMELSGCDAVFVLEGADIDRAVHAIAFGLRFNGSATCMAPRRLIVTDAIADRLIPRLVSVLNEIESPPLTPATHSLLRELTDEATLSGAKLLIDGSHTSGSHTPGSQTSRVTLVDHATSSMRLTCSDIFAPVLTILRANDADHAIEMHRDCPYALSAAVFGPQRDAEEFANRLRVGTVLINDIIVSSADPRASFGGLGASGYGATRGAAGLLEMTAIKTVIVQRSRSLRAYQPTTASHAPFFTALMRALHCKSMVQRLAGLRDLISTARKLKP